MKKWSMAIAIVCFCSMFAGCGAGGQKNDDESKVKLGMAIYGAGDVTAAAASIDAVAAAVLVDDDGKIIACRLDEVQLKPTLENGALKDVTDFRTKGELGDSYGMKAAGAKQEWYEQAQAFCKYAVGKTGREVGLIETTDGKPTDTDLSAGCTIDVTDFMKAVSMAAAEAKEYDLAASNTFGLAMSAARAAGSADDAPKYTVKAAAVTVDAAGKVTGCAVDELEKKLSVTDGRFAADAGEIKTKRQQKDEYNMKAASGIGREWYEQIDALQSYLSGKSTADIGNIALTDGKATDADLSAGCTIAVDDLLKTVQKAMTNAA